MILKIPLAIWFGILTAISLVITLSLGIATLHSRKPLLKYHKFSAFITIIIGTVHIILAILLWFYGIVI
jgi:hypothetical protein